LVVKTPDKPRPLPEEAFEFDWHRAVNDPEVDCVVEMTNDADEAFLIARTALENGKHVVSANKKMLAHHLTALLEAAAKGGATLRFEAAVAASIPILRILETHFRQEEILSLSGILNGTSNYILTKMNEGGTYEEALAEAQRLGFAETDPTMDVDGFDAAFKLALLSWQAYGILPVIEEMEITGIRSLRPKDMRLARERGERARLVAETRLEEGSLRAKVAPQFVSKEHPLYAINNEFNAIALEGAFAGQQIYIGRGAGADATGSAVLADVAYIATLVSGLSGE
jgi:homoserine dehydrogenase